MVRDVSNNEKLFIGGDFDDHVDTTIGGLKECMMFLDVAIENNNEKKYRISLLLMTL